MLCLFKILILWNLKKYPTTFNFTDFCSVFESFYIFQDGIFKHDSLTPGDFTTKKQTHPQAGCLSPLVTVQSLDIALLYSKSGDR